MVLKAVIIRAHPGLIRGKKSSAFCLVAAPPG
jgi:hypothetical protein